MILETLNHPACNTLPGRTVRGILPADLLESRAVAETHQTHDPGRGWAMDHNTKDEDLACLLDVCGVYIVYIDTYCICI